MSTGIQLWILSLVIGLVVIGVVAFLLNLVKKTAVKIDETAADIWTQGKLDGKQHYPHPFVFNQNKSSGRQNIKIRCCYCWWL